MTSDPNEPQGTPVAPVWRWRVALGLFSGAYALRALHVFAMRDTSFVEHPTIDPAAYLARAKEILGGAWFPKDVFFQDPLYPYLLAGMIKITGGATLGPYFLHAAFSALTAVFVYIAAARFINHRAGWIAGAVCAAYAPFVFLDAQLEKNTFTLATILGVLAFWPIGGARCLRRILICGLLLGCGALLRGNFLLFIPLLSVWFLVNNAGISFVQRTCQAVVFIIGAFLPMMPFTWHNYRVSGEFVVTTSQAGTAFYLGNNPQNKSGGIHAISFNRQIPEYEADDWKREADRRAGRSLTRKEVSQFWFDAAKRHILSDPGLAWWMSLVLRKAELIVNRIEVPDNAVFIYVERLSPTLAWNPVRFATAGPLALAGFILLLRRFRRLSPIYIIIIVYGATLLLFPVSDRFRAPLAAVSLIFAGGAIDCVLTWAGARNWKKGAGAGLLIVGAAILVNHEPWLQPEDTNIQRNNALLKAFHDDAGAWINAGRFDRADAVLKDAMADEWLAKKSRLNLDLAMVRWRLNKDATAARELVNKSVSALMKEGISVPDGYLLYAEILESQQKGEMAAYWRARAEAADLSDWVRLHPLAEAAAQAGQPFRAMGLLDELVFADQRSPVGKPPTESYLLLARLQRSGGQAARAKDTIQKLADRGGVIPDEYK